MKSHATVAGRYLLFVAVCAALGLAQSDHGANHHTRSVAKKVPLTTHVAVPLYFESHGSSFVARGARYNLVLDAGQARLGLHGGEAAPAAEVVIAPRNAHPSPEPVAEQRLSGTSHYYNGNEPSKWKTRVPHFGRVRYREIYDGVDLVYYGVEGKIEFDFVVAPGVDPSAVELAFDGVDGLNVDESGDLLLATPAGTLRQHKPVAYQEGPEGRTLVAAAYALTGDGAARFELGSYDRSRPLIIDPILDYSSYVGGDGWDWVNDVVLDSEGNIYACGGNGSSNFPAGSQLTGIPSDPDAFIMKLSPDGKNVLYRAYIGGTGDDVDYISCGVQSDGSAVMAGFTEANDFPQLGSVQPVFGGGDYDVFVTRFSPTGEISFSTYLGGSGYDGPSEVKVGSDDNIYVAGWTSSANFPLKNPLQDRNRGIEDAFLTKLTPTGSSIVYSTYYGGSDYDFFESIAVDATGAVYGAGATESANFPVSEDAYQQFLGGVGDAFVMKVNPSGSAVVFSTYLGGNEDDYCLGLALDTTGNTYLGGTTYSDNFPAMSIQQNRAGNGDGFLTKVNATGTDLVYSTYLGGTNDDEVIQVGLNQYGEVYAVGWTDSQNFPVKDAVQSQNAGPADGFLTKLNAAGTALVYSTFMGGNRTEIPLAIALDPAGGKVIVSGRTQSPNFPTASPAQSGFGDGEQDGILSIYVEAVGTSAASYARGELAPDSIGAVFGDSFAAATEIGPADPLSTSLLDVKVTITDSEGIDHECGMFFIAGGRTSQINIHIPADVALGSAVVTVTMADGRQLRSAIEIVSVAPGLFSQNASGQGVAAANVARFSNGVPTYDLAAQLEGGVWVARPIPAWGESEQIYIFLYGTGLRNGQNVTATIDGVPVGVTGPVAQGEYLALDQINLGPIPRSLIGRGTVEIVILIDGKPVNVLTVAFAPAAN